MPSDLITKQELIDAKADAQDLEDIVNGAVDLNGTGLVPTRTGGNKRTISKLMDELEKRTPAIAYATETALLADLAPGDKALAYALDTNKFYVKSGATGAGSWTTGPSAPRAAPNMLFDSFNRFTSSLPTLGGWGWYTGSSAITWTTSSSNIPVKTPVAQTGAVAGGFRKTWDTSRVAGMRSGEVMTVSALVFASNAGGARVSVFIRDAADANLATAVPSYSGVSGLQVVSAQITVPAGAHAKLLVVVEGSGNTAIETAAICASLSNRPPQITLGPSDPVYLQAWLTSTALDARYASASALSTVDPILPFSKNLFNINDPDVALGSFVNFNTGLLQTNASYNTTGFIPVVAGQTYTSSNTGQRAYYNSSKSYVSGDNLAGSTAASTFTVPAGCSFMRQSVLLSGSEWANFQVEAGSVETGWVAYGRSLNLGTALDGLQVDTAKLVDAAVTPPKASFMLASKNLFNLADAGNVLGSYVNYLTGNTVVNASYNATHFIPVVPGSTYSLSFSHQRAFYNASKAFVSGTNSGNPSTFTVPAGCFFARFSVSLSNWDLFQVELGASSTAYVPFGHKLDATYVPDSVWSAISAASAIGDKFKMSSLRNYHYLREKRTRATPEAARSHIGAIGDSFTQNSSRWIGGFTESEVAEQGDGGAGWIGFAYGSAGTPPYVLGASQPSLINGNARSAYTVQFVGSGWSTSYGTVPSPDACCATSSTAGNRIVVGIPAASGGLYPALTAFDLFWIGTANGVVRYSWDGGTTWSSNLNVQGTVGSCSFAALTGFSGGGGAQTLTIEVVSGTCSLAGCHPISSASGVIVHKLAATGRRAQDFATVAANASWGAALARLGLTTLQVLHGTNDQGSARTASQFSTDLQTIGDAVLTALPGCDILIVMPPENQRTGNAIGMKVLAAAAATLAQTRDWGFCNMQRDFGDPDLPTVYGSTGARPLFNSDLIHPEPTTGGRAMESALKRFYRFE